MITLVSECKDHGKAEWGEEAAVLAGAKRRKLRIWRGGGNYLRRRAFRYSG